MARLHLSLDLFLEILFGTLKVVVRLEVDPKLRTGAEVAAEPQRRIGTDASHAVDNRVEPVAWHMQRHGKRVNGHAERLQKLFVQDLAGVRQADLPLVASHYPRSLSE